MKILFALILTAFAAFADERALVDLTTGDVLNIRTTSVTPPANPTQWVILTRNAPPAFNPATQKLEKVTTVAPDKSSVTITWNIVALTQAEIDANTATAADNADRDTKMANVVNAIATLRQWATDSQSTVVTNGNNNAVTQTMVDRLGTFFDRFADLLEGQRLDK